MDTINKLEKIADLAGVDVEVVRAVLNGSSLVEQRVKERVLRILHEKNYDQMISRRQKTRGNYPHSTIAIVIPDVAHQFWFEIIRGISDSMVKQGYNLAIFNVARNQSDFYEFLIEEKFAGVIIIGTRFQQRVIDLMSLSDTKFCFADIKVDGQSSIYIDNEKGGALAATHLLEKGCKKIAYIGHNEVHKVQESRLKGFEKALQDAGLKIVANKRVDIHNRESYDVTKEILGDTTLGVDGVFYFCDILAQLGLQARNELGLATKIVGFDDHPMSNFLGLTSVRQPSYAMGTYACEEILRLINEDNAQPRQKQIIPELIVRVT